MKKKRFPNRLLLLSIGVIATVAAAYWLVVRPLLIGECVPNIREVCSVSLGPVVPEVPDNVLVFINFDYLKVDIKDLFDKGARKLTRISVSFDEGGSTVFRLALIGMNANNELMDDCHDLVVPPIPPAPGCPPKCKCQEGEMVNFGEATTYLHSLVPPNTIQPQ